MGDELVALGGAFLAAGILARMGRRIGLPTIPFFMLAGIIFGPNTPGIALVDDPHDLELLAALGLILLLFHLGLEFSLGDLLAGGRSLLAIGAIYLALNIGGGLAFGFALGWGTQEAFVIAGAIGISSSAIVTKLLTELHRLANPESRLILGIIVVEDVFLALYLALLQPVLGEADGAARRDRAVRDRVRVPARDGRDRAVGGRRSSAGSSPPPTTSCSRCASSGLAVLTAGIAEELGVSDAIGAFMIGLVLAETTVAHRIERLVLPLRDAFAAVFFFAFGLTIDPERRGRRDRAGAHRGRPLTDPERGRRTDRGADAGIRAGAGGEHRAHDPRPGRVLVDPRDARRGGRPRRAHRTVRGLLRAHPRVGRADSRKPLPALEPLAPGIAVRGEGCRRGRLTRAGA